MGSIFAINGRFFEFNMRIIVFRVTTVDGNPYEIKFGNSPAVEYASHISENRYYAYYDSTLHPIPNFPLGKENIKTFYSNSAMLFEAQAFSSNLELISLTGQARINLDDIGSSLIGLKELTLNNISGTTGELTGIENLVDLETIYLDDDGVGDLTDLSLLPNLTSVYLRGSGYYGDMTDLADRTEFVGLFRLTGGFTGDFSECFNNYTNISSFNLSNCPNLDIDVTDIGNLTNLNSVQLQGLPNAVGDLSSISALTLTGSQCYLNLPTCTWTYNGINADVQSFYIRLQSGEFSNSADIDQLLIDLDNSATTRTGTIDLRSAGAAAPTSASLAARNSLILKGRTILTN